MNLLKVGCIFPMAIWSELRTGRYRGESHRDDVTHFMFPAGYTLFGALQWYMFQYIAYAKFPKVIGFESRMGQFRDHDHQEDAHHFNIRIFLIATFCPPNKKNTKNERSFE